MTFEPAGGARKVKVDSGFRVVRLAGGGFRVSGRYVARVASMTDLNLVESVYRMQSTLRRIGVDRALRGAGIRAGDTVYLGELEFEWSEDPLRKPPKLPGKKRRK